MVRLRHTLISMVVAALLSACGPSAPSSDPGPVVAAKPAATHPAPLPATPRRIKVAPEWRSRVPEIQPDVVDETLAQAEAALARGQLERGGSPGPGALELYLAVLKVDPDNEAAQIGIQSALDALLERGRLSMRAGRFQEADRVELMARSLLPEHPDLPGYRQHLAAARLAATWVEKANQAAAKGRLVAPAEDSASGYLKQAQQVSPDFEPAQAARAHWNNRILDKAWKAAKARDFAGADALLLDAAAFWPLSPRGRVVELRVIELRQALTDAALAQGNRAVDALALDRADTQLERATRIAAQPAGIDALRQRIYLARHYGPFKPGQVFSEFTSKGQHAPEMVVIPFGQFQMGSAETEPDHQPTESPLHEVEFKRGFAIARNETTVADFTRFVAATGYRSVASRAGRSTVYDEKGNVFSEHEGVDWRRDHVGRVASAALPVVHIALADALAYARWLSTVTGKRYRLPSEAEFEYVLRAGSHHRYPWGDAAPGKLVANLPGDGDRSRLGRSWGNAIPHYRDAFWGPAPVRNFPIERFGTFDMMGNVSEWTLDCWHDSYQRAPLDGSAWVNPGCPQRVIRGASWASALDQARSASRLPMETESSSARLGFRVVREL